MAVSTIHSLPYAADSAPLMRALGALPGAVFLDSAGGFASGLVPARWDILSALPVATLSASKAGLRCDLPLPAALQNDFTAALDWLLAQFRPTPQAAAPDLPFTGGAIGYLGYPKITENRTLQLQDACVGIYQWALLVDHQLRKTQLVFGEQMAESQRQQVLAALDATNNSLNEFKLLDVFHRDVTHADYFHAFDRIKHYIQAGDCYQVNLTQRFSSHYSGDPLDAYLRLRRRVANPMSAYVALNQRQLLCFSPERFLRLRDGELVTQPIKGTRPRGPCAETDRQLAEELTGSEKDRAENLMIVDLLRNDLGVLCEYGSVQPEQLFALQSFSNVHHLVSTVRGTPKPGISAATLLHSCFPGGSITGAPKLRAMEIIQELESFSRESYCGVVAYIDFNGAMDSNITIRSLLCREEKIYCWAGGGIVEDSQAASEYQESLDKINNLIYGLN